MSSTVHRLKFAFVTSLTLGRIPLILIFLVVNLFVGAETKHPVWFGVAFYAMVLSALTDLFDGYFARKFDMVTKMGGYADPLMDKIFYLVAFPTLIFRAGLREEPFAHQAFLVAFTIVFLVRDQWVTFMRSIGSMHDMEGKANWSGKLRTFLTFPMACCVYWYLEAPDDWRIQLAPWFIYAFESLCLAVTVLSTWVYTRYYWPALRREMKTPPAPGRDS